MDKKIYILLLILIFLSFNKTSYSDDKNTAVLQIINKITGKSFFTDITTAANKNINGLVINISSCLIKNNDEFIHASFLKIISKKNNEKLFSGWIFSNNQSISEFAHEIYAIKLVKCIYTSN